VAGGGVGELTMEEASSAIASEEDGATKTGALFALC